MQGLPEQVRQAHWLVGDSHRNLVQVNHVLQSLSLLLSITDYALPFRLCSALAESLGALPHDLMPTFNTCDLFLF